MTPASSASPEGRTRHARDDLRVIAGLPRPVGSAAEASALAWCRDRLASRGFTVRDLPLSFSSFVGSYLLPLIAVGAAAAMLAASAYALGLARPVTALLSAVLLMVLPGVVLVAARFSGAWVLEWPTHRRQGVNLMATRGSDPPAIWLVAHVDTKSQPMPSLVRAGAIVVAAIALPLTLVMFVVAPGLLLTLLPIPLLGGLAALVLSFATVGQVSPGAADNGTGVAAVLRAADLIPPDTSLGVLISTGEELGLAGVRGFVKTAPPATAINLDTLDDRGRWWIMTHGAASHPLATSLTTHWQQAGEPLTVSRLIPGILTDGVALAQAGWSVVTLSAGDRSTLLRIHTPHDTVQHLTGQTAERAAELLAGFLTTR